MVLALPSTDRLPSTLSAPRLSAGVVRGFIGTIRPSDSSYLPIRLRLLTFPNRPGIAVATAGGMRSPRFRRVPFERNGVFDHGRAVAPRMTVRNMLPSTFSTVSAPANLYLSRLNNPLHSIAVYASPWSSPSTPQHSLPGDPLRSYPGRTSTGWNAPASPGAPKIYSNDGLFGSISVGFRVVQPLIAEYGVLTWRTKDNVLSASPSPRPSLSRPSARRAGDWGWRKEAH